MHINAMAERKDEENSQAKRKVTRNSYRTYIKLKRHANDF
jgi:hypothetical protein